MPQRSELIDTINWTTERLSNRVWSVSLGVLGTAFAYIIESSRSHGEPFLQPAMVAGPAALALVALLSDLLQYYVAQRQEIALLKRMNVEQVNELPFERDVYFRLRSFFYNAKILVCITAVGWLVTVSVLRTYDLTGGYASATP